MELDRTPSLPGVAPGDRDSAGDWRAEIASIDVLFGPGTRRLAARLVTALGCRRVLVVTDPGIAAAGHVEELVSILRQPGLELSIFDGVVENPTSRQVAEGVAVAHPFRPDCIVALGGGSAMDCAKGINFVLTNGGRISDYHGFGKATRPMLPAIGLPTTAGTGSEAQSYALISDSRDQRKMACGDRQARFRNVILDPVLTRTAPRQVAATAGLDALAHAVESHVSTRCNPVSRMFSREAWRLLAGCLEASLLQSATDQILGEALLASHLAGAAIEQSMLGAAHAAANPLTARFGIPHGQAVALLLPHVVRYNGGVAESGYQELGRIAGLDLSAGAAEAIATRIEVLRREAGLPERLQTLGISEPELGELAVLATREWTGRFNPRPVGESAFRSLYDAAF